MPRRLALIAVLLAAIAAGPGVAAGGNNGNGNGNGNENNGNGQSQSNGQGNGNGNANGQNNGNANGQGNGNGNANGQANGNGQENGNAGGNSNGGARTPATTAPVISLPVGKDGDAPASSGDADFATDAVRSGKALPLHDLIERAAEAHPGRVLDAKLHQVGAILVYELKIMSPDGRRIESVFYYARSGREVRR